jgi:hypothetical protein
VTAEPDLTGVVAAFRAAAARCVVIGGFAVIAHRVIRATEDVDLLIPDDEANDARVLEALRALGADVDPGRLSGREHLRVDTRAGQVDLLREGAPPLDFPSVDADALEATVDGVVVRVCGLASLVGFKRLADRPRDRLDLAELATRHGGRLPILPLPGLDEPQA